MSNADERGALGKRFNDLPTTPDSPDLAWEAMARHVLPPLPPEEEPDERRPFLWWWLAGAMLFILTGLLIWSVGQDTPEETIVAREVIPQTTQTRTTKDDEPKAVAPSNKKVPKLEAVLGGGQNITTKEQPSLVRSNQVGITKPSTSKVKTEERTPTLDWKSSNLVLASSEAKVDETRENAPKETHEGVRKEVRLIGQLPLLAIDPLDLQNPSLNVMVLLDEKELERKVPATLSLMAGAMAFQSQYTEGAAWLKDEDNQLSPELSLRYDRPLGKKLFISTGIELRNYRFRTAFESVDTDARIYQPGTVDTIFRNLTTGEDRIVYTDTVGGTRTLRFGNDNTVMEIGLPLMIGRKWTLGRHDFSLAAGPRLGLILTRTGRTVIEANQVADLEAAPQFSRNLNWAGRLELGYGFQLTPAISLLGKVGAESALSDWAETAGLKQRPTVLNGRLGLRFTLK